jgi:hypothetical protein
MSKYEFVELHIDTDKESFVMIIGSDEVNSMKRFLNNPSNVIDGARLKDAKGNNYYISPGVKYVNVREFNI